MLFLSFKRAILVAISGAFLASALAGTAHEEAAKPSAHVIEDMEGWKVRVDTRLREEVNADLGRRAQALLRAKLAEIVAAVPKDKVEILRRVPIWLDLNCGNLHGMQYHPSAGWLKERGFDPALAGAVHISSATTFASARHQQIQPWCVLHELAHAYHDQILGFENEEVMAVWEAYKATGHGDQALNYDGRKVRHYALTNQKEFFAEMTEAYFGTNDFFPFVHGELKKAEPRIHALLRRVWGITPIEAGE